MTATASETAGSKDRRKEKLAAIARVLGQDVADRLHGAQGVNAVDDAVASRSQADTDRIAWQTNRLIQRLRHMPTAEVDPGPNQGTTAANPMARLPDTEMSSTLQHEHPAIIAHVLRSAPQARRVAFLHALPGPLARSIIRRLKDPNF